MESVLYIKRLSAGFRAASQNYVSSKLWLKYYLERNLLNEYLSFFKSKVEAKIIFFQENFILDQKVKMF